MGFVLPLRFPSFCPVTLDFLSKKHIQFDQDLDFLSFHQGIRGKAYGKIKKT